MPYNSKLKSQKPDNTTMKKIFFIYLLLNFSTIALAKNTYESGKLDNGFEYHFLHVPSEPNRIDVRLKVGVGASDEIAGEKGVAHMVEHMVFRASPEFPNGIGDSLMGEGWLRGKHFNAMTNYERTLYMFSPPKGTQQLEKTLNTLFFMVQPHDFSEKDWKKERQVVLAEWRSKRGLNERMNRKRTKVIRSGSRQARYGILGTIESISNAPVKTLQTFHQKWYVPNNMQLMISGDFNSNKTLDIIKASFGKLKKAELPNRSGDYYEPKLQNGWHAEQIQDRDSGYSRVAFIFRLDDSLSRQYDNTAGMKSRIIDHFATRILMSRFKNQQRGLPKTISNIAFRKSDIGHHTIATGLFASVTPDGHDSGISELMKIRAQLLKTPVSRSEFTREFDKYMQLIEKSKKKTTLPEPFGYAIMKVSTKVFNRQPVKTQAQIANIAEPVSKTITPDDVTARINKWLNADDRLVQLQAPSLTPINLPDSKKLTAEEKRWQSAELPPLLQAVEHGEGKFFDTPTVGKLVQAQSENGLNVTRWKLTNGDRVVILQTPLAEGKTQVKSIADVGFLNEALNPWQAQLASQLVWQSAPKGWTQAQLNDWKKQHKVSLSYELKPIKTIVSGMSPDSELENLLHLYHAYMQTPQIGEDYRDGIMPLIRQIPMRGVTRRSKKDNAVTVLRYGSSSYPLPKQNELLAVEPTDLLAQWQQINTAPVTHYVITEQTLKTLKPLLEKYLAGINRKSSYKNRDYRAKTGKKIIHKAIGEAGRAEVRLWSFSEVKWSPDIASQVAMLKQDAKKRLKTELRDKILGVYSIRFDSTYNTDNNRIETAIRFSTSPENADKLWKMADEVMQSFADSLNEKDATSIREDLAKGEKSRLQNADTWLNRLILSETYYGDARYLREMQTLADKATLPSLRQTARLMWSAENLRILVIFPYKTNK